jgi:spermidine dehydrogenase
MSSTDDKKLGMQASIKRLDNVDGVSFAGQSLRAAAVLGEKARKAGAAYCPYSRPSPGQTAVVTGSSPDSAGYYPPELTGMRGSGYPRGYVAGHTLRDGHFFDTAPEPTPVDDLYDLVIVGGGISGLSAAYFYQKKHGFRKKVLVLDNHDDFGGHAKRNEFTHGNDTRISNAGAYDLSGGSRSTEPQKEIFSDLGIDILSLAEQNIDRRFYSSRGMGQGVFFDSETFGEDKLLKDPAPWTDFKFSYEPLLPENSEELWQRFLQEAPMPEHVRKEVYRLYHEKKDYLAGLSLEEKTKKLDRMSYQDYVINVVGCDPMVCTYLRDRTFGSGRGLDATTALAALQRFGLPGLDGLGFPKRPAPAGKSATFHFPEGNATVARLLVRKLVPGSLPGTTPADSMSSRVKYETLDQATNSTRIRLNSTVVKVLNVTDVPGGKGVQVNYQQDDHLRTIKARQCVLACWFHIIPYLCPEMPEEQRVALNYNVHTPNLWVNVWLRNWTPFQKAGVNLINAPKSYFASLILELPVSMGDYKHSQHPEDPIALSMLRGYGRPGLHIKDQFRLGRIEMYETSFETYERETRKQLAAMFGPYGFDPEKDILGITVNRWGHGYSYWYSALYDDFLLNGGEPPHLRARMPFGQITIANTDSGGTDSTNLAIDMAYRAVTELDSL